MSLPRKISKPARDTAVNLKGASTAFWLIMSFTDEEMIVTAVIAERLGQGGSA